MGTTFHFTASGHALMLQRLDSDRPAPSEDMRKPLVLVFSGRPGSDYLRERLLGCRTDDGLTLQIYVSPVQTLASDRQDFQAVFG